MTARIIFCILCLCLNVPYAVSRQRVFTRKYTVHGLSDNQVQHILQLRDGRMVITTKGNINIYDGNNFRYIHYDGDGEYALEDYKGAYHVYEDSCHRLWLKDYGRLRCFDLKYMRYVTNVDSLFRTFHAGDKITDLFVDSEGGLWLVTPRNVCDEAGNMKVPKHVSSGTLQDLDISGGNLFLFYSKGNVWRVSLGKKGGQRHIAAYSKDKADLTAATSLVVKARNGDFYQLRCGRESVLLRYAADLSSCSELLRTDGVLHTLALAHDNSAYITCPKGIWHVSLSDGKYELVDSISTGDGTSMSSEGLNTIFFDSQGGTWLGTYNSGLLYAHPDRFRFRTVATLESLGLARDGLLFADKSKLYEEYGKEHCTDIQRDSRGWVWAGTVDGLWLFRQGKDNPEKFYAEDGLSNNYIHSIVEDFCGNMWIGTSCGITRISVSHTDSMCLGFERFGTDDGCLDGEYCTGRAWRQSCGDILMEGAGGWTVWHPDSVDTNPVWFCPMLVGVTVNGCRLKVGDSLLPEAENFMAHFDFDTGQNSLVFDISPLNYIHPARTVYAYRLSDGGDAPWNMVGNGRSESVVDAAGTIHLSFSYLPPGNYELLVKAAMNADVMEAEPLRVTFSIRVPWWQTGWAYTLYILLAVCILVAGVWLYNRMTRIRLRRKYKEDLLLLRIKNLIERCNEYKQEISRRTMEEPQPVSMPEPNMSAADYEFVDKAMALVERNLDTPGYGVEQLSRDLCMERTGLYKKMTHLLDKSPSVFIRNIRIHRAAELLRSGTMSVAEVAEKAGFSSSSYMSKCFVEEFGCTPSELVANGEK
ncbi:MAG: helix-turn-helix domain-containing protein [Bacteroides sp.]|nr:helix-turn-helix domain-containing protein [Roseburia sp.]MCM1346982.1 helix-turn-helix domain-containing protein [Bacteroides sp.]MCM1421820.1 helix-turn-helix domain-containing protein [Bacteroides sp.]